MSHGVCRTRDPALGDVMSQFPSDIFVSTPRACARSARHRHTLARAQRHLSGAADRDGTTTAIRRVCDGS